MPGYATPVSMGAPESKSPESQCPFHRDHRKCNTDCGFLIFLPLRRLLRLLNLLRTRHHHQRLLLFQESRTFFRHLLCLFLFFADCEQETIVLLRILLGSFAYVEIVKQSLGDSLCFFNRGGQLSRWIGRVLDLDWREKFSYKA